MLFSLIAALLTFVYAAVAVQYDSMGDDDSLAKQKFDEANAQSLLWGPFRSNLYVGIRPRVPQTLLSGLMWYRAESLQGLVDMRHECDNRQHMSTFGWTEYDPRYGGRETIVDDGAGMNVTADFVKSDDGNNWMLRVQAVPLDPQALTTIVWYSGMEGNGELDLVTPKDNEEEIKGDGHEVKFSGKSEPIGGDFSLKIDEARGNVHPVQKYKKAPSEDPARTRHIATMLPNDHVWEVRNLYQSLISQRLQKIQEEYKEAVQSIPPVEAMQIESQGAASGNVHLVEKTFVGSFEFTATFNLDSSKDQLDPSQFEERFEGVIEKFRDRFASKFQLSQPFNKGEYVTFAKEFLSQLLGGLGYFYGHQLVDRNANLDEEGVELVGKPEGPHELFTFVPSRTIFPRGFYWDEGFHLMAALNYDSDLVLDVIKSWFSQIDDDGWIAREEILGSEARSRVPDPFVVQNPNIANPPTMMLIFNQFLHMANNKNSDGVSAVEGDAIDEAVLGNAGSDLGDVYLTNADALNSYAEAIYPKLQRHYEWFRRTQRGEAAEFDRECTDPHEIYRWKGRDATHCLPSGLDDYPRCSAEADNGELNVDLISWMGAMTRSMAGIAKLLGKQEDAQKYEMRLSSIKANLNELHWSAQNQSYCDVGIDDYDEDEFECRIGYVTLMPFLNHLVDPENSEHLLPILKTISDPEQLWSEYGIRSLSKKDSAFHTDEDYWRGHIWMPMNYLCVDALHWYGKHPQTSPEVKAEANRIYKALRTNLVENVYREYKRTGYAWEQYNEATGSGQRGNSFLGWTSLVMNMMAMPEELM